MKNLSAFLLPVLLAVVAGVLNYWALKGEVKQYTTAKATIAPGEPIEEGSLERVAVRGTIHGAIEWEERGVLFQLPAPRRLEKGTFLLRQDIDPQSAPSLALEKDQVAINISLAGVEFEDQLLRVGQRIGFVIGRTEKPETPSTAGERRTAAAASPQDYRIVGPYRVVTLGKHLRDDPGSPSEGEERPSTLSIAVPDRAAAPLDVDVQALLEANEQRRIAAVVLYSGAAAPSDGEGEGP